jgi:hypothetical protein
MLHRKSAQPDCTSYPEGDLDDVLGVENYNRKTLAPPRFQRFTSDCGALLFWTGRKRLERIGVMEKRNDDAS